MNLVKGAGLLAAGALAFSSTAFAAQPYEYGLQLVMMGKSPVVTEIDFADEAARNACFCVSDMDGNGRLEFFLASMGEDGRYLDFTCYEIRTEDDVLVPVVVRGAESGLRPRIDVTGGKLTAYRHSDGSRRGEHRYHVDTSYRTGGEYLVARQLVSLTDGQLSVSDVATEQGVVTEGSRAGMYEFTPQVYRDANGDEIDKEAFERSVEVCVGNAQKTDAEFRWIPISELEKTVSLEENEKADSVWETLQKSWQGFRFGNAPRGYAWCLSGDGRSFYLDTDSINIDNLPKGMTYRVLVKVFLDADGSPENDIIYGFESQNDVLVAMVFDKSTGQWEPGETPAAKAVWETLKPFLRQRGIPFSDTWVWE